MSLIHVKDLVKDFRIVQPYSGTIGALRTFFFPKHRVKRVVDHINLDINEGEIIGYVGSNGAGKSTTIKMLTGILIPTSGTIEVAGIVPWKQTKRNARNIGVVFGQRSHLWWDLPLIDSFKLIAKIYEIPPQKFKYNLEFFADLLGIDEFIETPVRLLSLGQRMRGDIVATMLYEPRILYLDEPTVGLDIFAKERIRLFIEKINHSMHTTVLLTTHDLSDVDRLCQRIIMIDRGRIIHDGLVTELKRQYAHDRVLVVQLETGNASIEISNATVIHQENTKFWLKYDSNAVTVAALIANISAHYFIVDLSMTEPKLEAVIRKMYGEIGN